MKVGLNLLIISVHPMRRGATLMSSILFNVALVLVACLAVIQFCAQAFALYAYETAIYEIFTNQVILSLQFNITIRFDACTLSCFRKVGAMFHV